MRPSAVFLPLVLICGGVASVGADSNHNLLLITIDTLRADYLGANGSKRVKTPHLDKLARGGVNFTQARTPVPLTLPAHASILTGSYPPTHGVRDNGSDRMAESQRSIAEVLREDGYITAAFVGSFVLDQRFGLAQGFDTYDDRVWSDVSELESLEAERPAGQVARAFEQWLAQRSTNRPFFVWIHLYDPHAPYEPPEPYRSEYPDDPYAGEVAYTDQVIGEILEHLGSDGSRARTVVAVVGDHGEGLGEHGELTHSVLIYNSTLHVPMLLHAPSLLPHGRSVDSLARTIDLAPTLLDYLGLDTALGEGASLRSWIEAGDGETEAEPELTAYSESLFAEHNLGWSPLRGLESGGKRLIVAPSPELYDLVEDPRETKNLAATEPSHYQAIKGQLVEVLQRLEESSGLDSSGALDAESLAKLRSLGYLSGTTSDSRNRKGPLVDPKDRMEIWNRLQRGISLFGHGDYRTAARVFAVIVEDDPLILMAHEFLGSCWLRLSEIDRAEKVYGQALDRGLDSPELHRRLGQIHVQRGHLDLAGRELEIAVAMDPRSVEAQFELGQIRRRVGRSTQAIEHYRAALDLNPSYLWAWNGLAMTLSAGGEPQEALVAFRRVVEIDPEGAPGYFNLAVHLERVDRPEESVDAYRRYLELAGDPTSAAQRRQAQAAIDRLMR